MCKYPNVKARIQRQDGLEIARQMYAPPRLQADQRDREDRLINGETAIHGAFPPAIDRARQCEIWRQKWRAILKSLTPLQRRALELELMEVSK
jgi:hypothetical protein